MPWQLFVAAALPLILIWLLWRLQTISVEVLRRSLLVLDGRWDQKWLYAVVSWFGTFLHELSHATVLLLSGHGVKEFRAGVEEGHVLPARMHRGAGTLTFLLAALAPLFVPPALVLVALALGVHLVAIPFFTGPDTLAGFWDGVQPFFRDFTRDLLSAIAALDLANWRHAIVFALILLGAPGSRPSHVRSRFHAKGDAGDVAALRQTIRKHPLPFLVFLALVYAGFLAAAWKLPFPSIYWFPIEVVWAIAITGIVLALFGAGFWALAGLDGRASALVAWVGPALFVLLQLVGRIAHWPLSIPQLNGISLAAWLAAAIALGQILPRRTR